MNTPPTNTLTPPLLEQPRYKFKIPKGARKLAGDPTSFTIKSFDVGQELDALRAAGAYGRFDYELLQRCVIEIDGKPVDQGRDWLPAVSPPVRALMVVALNKISVPEKDDERDFLASMEVVQ